jgi:transcriptional regulator with XRE-family HTH domain
MYTASLVRRARQLAAVSQRELAARSGIAQPVIARIESGRSAPRADTLAALLSACGFELALVPKAGVGIDRTAIRELLRLTPAERARIAVEEARALQRLSQSAPAAR